MSYGLDHLPDHVFGRLLFRWVDGARRYAGWVLALALAATAAILVYTVDNLGMNTDTEDMISEELPFRQAVKDYDRAFPQFDDVLVVVIDAETPDLAEDAAAALAARLEQEEVLFKTVYRPGSGEFFAVNGFLYLDLDELEDLADNLAEVQPLIAALARDPSLRRLFAELEFAIEALREG
ncbi:MAG: hopanoid biosynthesis-associated RND transporter HpnN, partial [Alphaproteobacteria bacterium]